MAKVCMLNREIKRKHVAKRDAAKRASLKELIVDATKSFSERMAARDALNGLDRNGAESRQRKRCALTGRPRAFYNRFGLCRNKLRELASKGLLPGVRKASW
jgi:small subunit ribosomal protein S14